MPQICGGCKFFRPLDTKKLDYLGHCNFKLPIMLGEFDQTLVRNDYACDLWQERVLHDQTG